MQEHSASYDLNELSDQAGVTPRTVRYYIQQGLLRSPGSPGPGAKYDEGHLLRLRLIRRLQREHLPLSEIRRQLESMTHDDVRKALESPTVRSPVVEYVERVLSEKKAEPRFRGALSFLSERVPASAAKLGAGAPMPTLAAHAGPERSQWDRVSLSPDLELNVRRPLSRAQNKIVEKLLDYARRLLEEDTP